MSQMQNQTLEALVREQLDSALAGCRSTRQCPELEDRDFLFESMTYNLLLWLQHRLRLDFGIADDKVTRKFDGHLAQRTDAAVASNRTVHPLHATTLSRRMAQMSAQFIRCVANHLFIPKPFRAILPAFRAAQWAYL